VDLPSTTVDLPHPLHVDGRHYVVDRATRADVAAVVSLLRDDVLGSARESAADDDLRPYLEAFEVVDGDPRQLLAVVRRHDGEVVGTLQLTFLRTLSRRGGLRMQVEAVRVSGSERGAGLGRALMNWAVEVGRARGAVLAQLTTDRRRADAHRFYERLGWVDTHKGMKLDLHPDPDRGPAPAPDVS
jgi:GNAT superfamily N-acetyltransferase